jgi:hypothetical protein
MSAGPVSLPGPVVSPACGESSVCAVAGARDRLAHRRVGVGRNDRLGLCRQGISSGVAAACRDRTAGVRAAFRQTCARRRVASASASPVAALPRRPRMSAAEPAAASATDTSGQSCDPRRAQPRQALAEYLVAWRRVNGPPRIG